MTDGQNCYVSIVHQHCYADTQYILNEVETCESNRRIVVCSFNVKFLLIAI